MTGKIHKLTHIKRWASMMTATIMMIAFCVVAMRAPALQIDESFDQKASRHAVDTYAEAIEDTQQAVPSEVQSEEETEYDPEIDLNHDGIIDEEEAEAAKAAKEAELLEEEPSADPVTDDQTGEPKEEDTQTVPQNQDPSEAVPQTEVQEKTDETSSAEDAGQSTAASDEQKASDPEQVPSESVKPAPSTKPAAKPAASSPVKKVDTAPTDSKTDAAPQSLRIQVTHSDMASVVPRPDTSVTLSSITGSRDRATSNYAETLLKDYNVEFSSDFALIMEEIEDDYELKYGLISHETYDERMERLEKGVIFGIKQSSALAKDAADDEELFMTEDQADLMDRYAKQMDDPEAVEEEDQVTESQIVLSSYHYTNWPDILAVYADRQFKAGSETVKFNQQSKEALAVLFDEMNDVEIIKDDEGLETACAEWTNTTIDEYLQSRYENGTAAKELRERLEKYTESDYLMMCSVETGSRQLTLAAINAQDQERIEKEQETAKEEGKSEEEIEALNIPLSDERKAVVLSAQTLNGKIHYFWGGKYNAFGWNKYWSTPQIVSSAGSSDTGQKKPYGLDCSGFVSWSFVNGLDNAESGLSIGQGTASQWVTSEAISDEKAQVGDLVFLRVPSASSINHVGILIGRDCDGNWLAIHCNASDDNVAVDRAYDVGFRYLRTPLVYQDQAED